MSHPAGKCYSVQETELERLKMFENKEAGGAGKIRVVTSPYSGLESSLGFFGFRRLLICC